ncbi:unnamed protein product, partial [Prorocentrum cordatum]
AMDEQRRRITDLIGQLEDETRQSEEKATQAEERLRRAEEEAQLAEESTEQADEAARRAEEQSAQAEERARQAEAQTREAGEQAKQAEEKAKRAEEGTKQAEEKTRQAEELFEQVVGEAKRAEEKAKQAEEKSKQAEEKSKQAEEKTRQAEEKTRQAEEEVKQAKEIMRRAEEAEAKQAEGKSKQAKAEALVEEKATEHSFDTKLPMPQAVGIMNAWNKLHPEERIAADDTITSATLRMSLAQPGGGYLLREAESAERPVMLVGWGRDRLWVFSALWVETGPARSGRGSRDRPVFRKISSQWLRIFMRHSRQHVTPNCLPVFSSSSIGFKLRRAMQQADGAWRGAKNRHQQAEANLSKLVAETALTRAQAAAAVATLEGVSVSTALQAQRASIPTKADEVTQLVERAKTTKAAISERLAKQRRNNAGEAGGSLSSGSTPAATADSNGGGSCPTPPADDEAKLKSERDAKIAAEAEKTSQAQFIAQRHAEQAAGPDPDHEL